MRICAHNAIMMALLLLAAVLPLCAQTSEDMAFVNRTGVSRNGLSIRFISPVDTTATQPVIVDAGALPVAGTAAPFITTTFPTTDTVNLIGGTVLNNGRLPATTSRYMRFTGPGAPAGALDVVHAVWLNNLVPSHTVVRFRATNLLGVPANEITVTLLDSTGAPLTVSDILISNDLGFSPYGCGYSLIGMPGTSPTINFGCDISGYESEVGMIQLTCTDAREVAQILVRWSSSGVKKGSSASRSADNDSGGEDNPVDAALGLRLSANQNIARVWPRRGVMNQQSGLNSKDLYLSGSSVAPGAAATERGWVTIASLDTGPTDIRFTLERWYRPAGGAVPEKIYYEFNELTGATTFNAASAPGGSLNATVSGHTLGTQTGQFHKGLKGSGGSGTASFVNSGWAPNLGAGAYSISFWIKRQGTAALTTLQGGLMGASGLPVSVVLIPGGITGAPPQARLTVGTVNCNVDLPQPFIGDGVVVTFTRDAQNVIRGYRNGTQYAQVSAPAHNFTATNTLRVGSIGTTATAATNIVLDEFRLYSHTLTAAEVAGTYTSALASPTSQAQFQTQGNQLTFTVDGLSGTGFHPVDVYRPVGSNIAMLLYSPVSGAPGDVMITSGTDSLRPQEALLYGSPINSVVLNLDITAPTFGSFFGLTFTTPLPIIPAGTPLPLSGPIDFSLQALVLSPTSPGGVVASQPIGVHATAQGSGAVVAGPAQDDNFVVIQPGAAPLCGPQTVSFYGTAYTQFWVNANGNITFGAGDFDFTPTATEFMSGAPRIAALWSDMGPQVSGNITITCFGGAVVTRWDEIPGTNIGGIPPLFSPTTVHTTFHPNGALSISEYSPPRVWRSTQDTSIMGISPGGGLGIPAQLTWSTFAGQGLITNTAPNIAPFQFTPAGAPSGFSEIDFPNANGQFFRVW